MARKPTIGLNKRELLATQRPHFDAEAEAEAIAEVGRKIEALEMLADPLSDLNLRLFAAQVAQLQAVHPANRNLLVRIYRDEETRREGPKIWRAIFPND